MGELWSSLIVDLGRDWALAITIALAIAGAAALLVLYWTKVGESHLIAKCVALAAALHLIVTLILAQWPHPPATESLPAETRVTIEWAPSDPTTPAKPLNMLESRIEDPVHLDPDLPEPSAPIVEIERPEAEPAPLDELPTAKSELLDPLAPPPEAAPLAIAPADALPEAEPAPVEPVERPRFDVALDRPEVSIAPPTRALSDPVEKDAFPAPESSTSNEPEPQIGPETAVAPEGIVIAEAPAPKLEARASDRPNLVPPSPTARPTAEPDRPTRSFESARIDFAPSAPPVAKPTVEDVPLPTPSASIPAPPPIDATVEPAEPTPKPVPRRFDLDMPFERTPSRPKRPTAEVAALDVEELIRRSSPEVTAEPANSEFWANRVAPNRLEIVFRHGGSEQTEQAVQLALEWLAAHQSADGRWDSDGFLDRCPEGDICTGVAVEKQSDTGLTGLSLLAFLGAGHTHLRSDQYRETVRRGLSWLLRTQRADGDLQLGGRIYCHAMATIALTEAYAMTKDARLRDPAQRAITWLAQAQHAESGGWRYGPNQFGDTSVFGWAVLALRSARNAGLDVPSGTWAAARRWLPLVSSGSHGGLAAYRPGYAPSHAMTAEALFCRQVLGDQVTDGLVEEASTYVLSRIPDPGDYHLYYWYYGTLALFQMGGPNWDRWNDRLTSTLLGTQRTAGHARGSWDPGTPFGIDGGRIFATSCSALCLEVYYRYLPIYRETAP